MSKAPEPVDKQLTEIGRYQLLIDSNPRRRRLLADLALATNALETIVDIMAATAESATFAVMTTMPDMASRADTKDMQSSIDQVRPQLRAMFTAILPPQMAMIYSKLSDSDLEKYAAETRKPLLRSLNQIYTIAFTDGMRRQAAAVGVAFAKNIRASKI